MVEGAVLAVEELRATRRGLRFARPGALATGLVLLALIAVAVVLGPWLSPYAYDEQSLALLGEPRAPSLAHWLGTDELGRDVLTRLLFGGRISLAVGLAGAAVATGIGTLFGALSGYFGGWVDQVLMRFTDVMLSIPALPLVLVVAGLIRPSPLLLVLLIATLIWTSAARLVRGHVRAIRTADYIAAARTLGAGPARIIVRHVLPNAVGAIAVSATIAVGGAIMLESALSFLGFGIQPPMPTWGNLLNQAAPWLVSAPWMSIPPGVLIFLTMIAVNLLGEGLRARQSG
ncbi:ABC transporter permease [Sphingomonas ginsenosidivorax]|uniref:ABC transporter permease n=1 Tax=Sphingomonas ginsenosidivorax TaxID=862135 RepID=A0A5C6UBX1_9SPHN|nr:ABC transporter permease [Sphingomonas ginsenosidivorax]TXC70202.1 ABC transporter permease [Sphingomonas ginsenosidivorax]